jgi:hypothetical protein
MRRQGSQVRADPGASLTVWKLLRRFPLFGSAQPPFRRASLTSDRNLHSDGKQIAGPTGVAQAKREGPHAGGVEPSLGAVHLKRTTG